MHELSIAQSLLDTVIAAAAEHGGKRISTVRLRIGGLRQVVEESLRQAFAILSEGSIAENAAVEIDWVRSVWRCTACSRTVEADETGEHCPCRGVQRSFEGSDDLLLTSLDLECDDED